MTRSSLSTLLALSLTAALTHAGEVHGRMIDSEGNPVPNALFEFKPTSGGELPIVSGGFTDANGDFTTTVTPDGAYSLIVYPLAPPQSRVVTRRIQGVQIGPNPLDLGVQVLEVGALMSGHVVNTSGTPLVSVGLEFVAAPDFQPLDFRYGDTSASGDFQVAVPYGSCELRFKPGQVPYYGGPDTAATTRTWTVTSETMDVGTIVMPQGHAVFGFLREQSTGNPVDNGEIDVYDASTGRWLYTPDNTPDNNGNFLLTLPDGSYDLHVVPGSNGSLCTTVLHAVDVPTTSNLGLVQLLDGVDLRGRVQDASGANLAGVEVQLVDSASQLPILVFDNLTDASGHFRMTVPLGTFDVVFSPPFTAPYARAIVPSFLIDDDADQDATLPPLAFFTNLGSGTPGTGGITPTLRADGGTPRLGNLGYALTCGAGRGDAQAFLALSLDFAPPVFGGPQIQASPIAIQAIHLSGPAGVAGAGSASFPLPLDPSSVLVGQELRAQAFVRDPAATGGIARSPRLRATIEP